MIFYRTLMEQVNKIHICNIIRCGYPVLLRKTAGMGHQACIHATGFDV